MKFFVFYFALLRSGMQQTQTDRRTKFAKPWRPQSMLEMYLRTDKRRIADAVEQVRNSLNEATSQRR